MTPLRPTAVARAADTGTRGRSAARRSLRRHWQLYVMLAVPLLWFVVFKYVPMVNAVIAFKQYNVVDGIWGSDWVGLANFQRFFDNPVFGRIVSNTFILSVYAVLAGFPVPIVLALAINEVRLRFFARTVQLVTYAPFFISTVIIVSMTILVLSPRIGLLSDVFGFFGADQPNVLGDPNAFRHVYVWTDVWQTAGYSAVIYLAALAGIDPTLYEAARVDGANRLQKIIAVDLPGIAPTAVIILILGVGNVMSLGFEKAFLLQNPLNLSQSEVIATYTYKVGLINADFSLASAIGLFNSAINLVLLVTVNRVARRVTGSGLW
ncbi:ABC transporter permease [Kineococcus aurantiacus]|uniref:ABC transporter permease n=1 Tax=Kineococcus aurantiacus TaxID=37633 RepID=UPI001FEC933E|nr:ABC transporter permease subunit [Kineococcus aurantiacus]